MAKSLQIDIKPRLINNQNKQPAEIDIKTSPSHHRNFASINIPAVYNWKTFLTSSYLNHHSPSSILTHNHIPRIQPNVTIDIPSPTSTQEFRAPTFIISNINHPNSQNRVMARRHCRSNTRDNSIL